MSASLFLLHVYWHAGLALEYPSIGIWYSVMVQSLLATGIALFPACCPYCLATRQRLNLQLGWDQLAIDLSGNLCYHVCILLYTFLHFKPFRQTKRVKAGRPFWEKRHSTGKLITIVRGMDYFPLCSESCTSWTGRFSLDNVYIISLLSTSTVLGMIFVGLLLIAWRKENVRFSLFESQDSL